MHLFKRFFDFILFGNIYVALGTVCLVQSTAIQLQLTTRLKAYCFLVFFATLFIYNFQRIFYKLSETGYQTSIRRAWIAQHNTSIRILTVIGLVGVGLSFFFNTLWIIVYLAPLLALSIFYFAPFIKLRKRPLLKLLTLVLVWTMVTAVVPILINNNSINSDDILHITARFLFMVAICIPFDIRDVQLDRADQVITLPQLTGEKKAKWLAFLCTLVYILLIAMEYLLEIVDLKVATALLICAAISGSLILMSSSKRSEYFYVAGIDGTMLLQGVLVILANYM